MTKSPKTLEQRVEELEQKLAGAHPFDQSPQCNSTNAQHVAIDPKKQSFLNSQGAVIVRTAVMNGRPMFRSLIDI